jgi:hypothetical protein
MVVKTEKEPADEQVPPDFDRKPNVYVWGHQQCRKASFVVKQPSNRRVLGIVAEQF